MTRTELIARATWVKRLRLTGLDEVADMLEADGDTSVLDDVVKQHIKLGEDYSKLQAAARLAFDALINGKKVRNGEGGTKYQPPLEDAAIAALKEVLK